MSACCVLDGDGEIGEGVTIAMTRGAATRFFETQAISLMILEAGGSSRRTTRIARALGHELPIGNPRRISYITKSYPKSDRNDAYKFADMGQVRPRLSSPVRLRSNKSHAGRTHQRVRVQLVSCRTAMINCPRACARYLGRVRQACQGTAPRLRVGSP